LQDDLPNGAREVAALPFDFVGIDADAGEAVCLS
jgi:hypothetical protein